MITNQGGTLFLLKKFFKLLTCNSFAGQALGRVGVNQKASAKI
jgi:hypothetical protein